MSAASAAASDMLTSGLPVSHDPAHLCIPLLPIQTISMVTWLEEASEMIVVVLWGFFFTGLISALQTHLLAGLDEGRQAKYLKGVNITVGRSLKAQEEVLPGDW